MIIRNTSLQKRLIQEFNLLVLLKACRMIQKFRWSDDPYEELTRIKSGLNVEYVCVLLASNNQRLQSADEMKKKTSGKKFSKIWVYLARLSPFWEIMENAVPFATGSWRKFKPDFFGCIESALGLRAPPVTHKTPAAIFHNHPKHRNTEHFQCTALNTLFFLYLSKNIII